ncbi:MAG: AcrR family transcriptional regulator [Rhodothermales bacterium]|jgi:AcrR family transcriptional regulator
MSASSDSKDLRRVILDEARHQLVKHGYNSLSMRRIAKEIGYSATAIYLHFEGKDALVHALIDEGMENLFQRLKEACQEQIQPATRLRTACLEYVRFGLENPEYYEIMHLIHPERMERFPAEMYRRARRSLEFIQDILNRGAAAGLFVLDSASVSAAAIWAMLHGVVSLLISRRVDVRIDPDTLIFTLVSHVVASVTLKPIRIQA